MFNRALAFILCFGILGQAFAVQGDCTTSAKPGTKALCAKEVVDAHKICLESQKANTAAAKQADTAHQKMIDGKATEAAGSLNIGGVFSGLNGTEQNICQQNIGKLQKMCEFKYKQPPPTGIGAIPSTAQQDYSSIIDHLNDCRVNELAAAQSMSNMNKQASELNKIKGDNSTAGGSTAGGESAGGVTAGSASSGGMGWLLPGLIGAGLGALLGSMLGGSDDSSSSSSDEEEPPSLPESPVAEESSSSSTSTASSVAVSQSSESISQPAIVTVPTVEPGTEAGSGDDEIFIAASGAIPDPDSTSSDASASGESSDSATTGGSTAIGGTTGTDGSRDTDVVDNSTGTGNSSSINVVDDNDETVVGLVSGSGGVGNRGLATYQYDSGTSDSSAGATGGGSGMLTGLPTSRRTGGRNLATGSSSSASSKSSSSASSKSSSSSSSRGSSSSKSSSSSSSLTSAQAQQQRNSVVDDLIARGLISASSSSSSVRRR